MLWRKIVWPLAALLLATCSPEQRAEMESERLDRYNLTEDQREIADSYIKGWKKSARRDLLRSREYGAAICYAKSVDMPASLRKPHLLYLEDYTEIDKNYYAFFRSHGISESSAERMGKISFETFNSCTPKAILKRVTSN